MISKKLNFLAIGFNYQEINLIQDELTNDFSHFTFDFALSVRDSLYRLNITEYDIVLLDLTSSNIENIIALKEIHQKSNRTVTIATVRVNEILRISNELGVETHYLIAKDEKFAVNLLLCVKKIINADDSVSQVTMFDRNLLEVLLNGLSEGVIFCDDDDNIILVNLATEKFLKMDRSQLLGKNIYDIPLGNEFEWLNKILKSAKSNIHLTASKKIEVNNKWLLLRFTPLYKEKNQYVGGFLYLSDFATVGMYEESQKGLNSDLISLTKLFSSKIIAEG